MTFVNVYASTSVCCLFVQTNDFPFYLRFTCGNNMLHQVSIFILQIVHVTLDNYEPDSQNEDDEERGIPHHYWVDEVVRSECRIGADVGPEILSCTIIRPRPEKKDPSLLTRSKCLSFFMP